MRKTLLFISLFIMLLKSYSQSTDWVHVVDSIQYSTLNTCIDSYGNMYGVGMYNTWAPSYLRIGFVMKLNSIDGSVSFVDTTRYNSQGLDFSVIAIDHNDDIIVSGSVMTGTNSSKLIAKKTNNSGIEIWRKLIDVDANYYRQSPSKIVVDQNNYVYVLTNNASQTNTYSNCNIIKLDPAGNIIFNINYQDSIYVKEILACDMEIYGNKIYLALSHASPPPQTYYSNYLLALFDLNGNVQRELIHTVSNDNVRPVNMDIDALGNAYMAGTLLSTMSADKSDVAMFSQNRVNWHYKYPRNNTNTSIPPTMFTHTRVKVSQNFDVFTTGWNRFSDLGTLSKFDTLGNLIFDKKIGEIALDVVSDANSNSYVLSQYPASIFSTGISHNPFIAAFDPLGNKFWEFNTQDALMAPNGANINPNLYIDNAGCLLFSYVDRNSNSSSYARDKFYKVCPPNTVYKVISPEVIVYPNPATSSAEVYISAPSNINEIAVYESNGLLNQQISLLSNPVTFCKLDAAHSITQGIYFIEVVLENGVTVYKKLVIE